MRIKFEISGLKSLWWWLRQASGDAAYENYLGWVGKRTATANRERGGGVETRGEPRGGGRERRLSPAEFYAESLERRYKSVNRCC